jgi:SAM-dependent methyltransferase
VSDLPAEFVQQVATAQYRDSTSRLRARAALHVRFSTATRDWWPWVYDRIAPKAGDTVLEVGAGTGGLWREHSDQLPEDLRLLLTDASPAMCDALRSLIGSSRWVVRCDAQHLAVPDRTADVVVGNHMLYHVPDIDRALSEMARVLVPGGRLVVTTNGDRHMWQLEELTSSLGITYAGTRLHHPFRLEDAPVRIGRRFTDVSVESYDDVLLVTDPDAVVAYLESVVDLDDSQRDRIHAATLDRINSDGAFRIDKSVGLITAQTSR